MDLPHREKSVAELRRDNRLLTLTSTGAVAIALLFSIKVFFQNVIIQTQVPGMPDGARIERNGMDVGAMQAYAFAVTNALASVNPSNGESTKRFVQPFLSPAAYTKVSLAIDQKIELLKAQHELGSYYFVLKRFESDEKLGRVFVQGDVHTVNAARDTAEPWVFEYPVRFANYRMTMDDVIAYSGDKAHNSEWIKAQKKK
ncbi:TraE/TraK family type IV conjugative transfer system protein [Burkholderia ubonensis]|uniref:TraE/TraK family type IV conjugative transfer system protein n=1 Tax=Burkholderia ubonensis TaxID=101571 RepID=UPI00075DDC1D|nr:TraE/TraK family type IV conjugative transfer system protein [Burkholderia ubonensis]KWK68774.1 type VI secretion protein [Burkholderia ubonensis]